MDGQLQAKPRGGSAGAHQLHCSVLRMQRSEVKWATERWVMGSDGQFSVDDLSNFKLCTQWQQ